jgi:hypothetical protein
MRVVTLEMLRLVLMLPSSSKGRGEGKTESKAAWLSKKFRLPR